MLREASLEDRYDVLVDEQILTGNQALIRVALLQAERDRRAGLRTAAYVSGYRGSPLGGLDMAADRARPALEAAGIRFHPGLNEELAATAVWGSQQAGLVGEARQDGVCGYWYGKGPGVDRSGDAFKHGNLAGSAKHGGVLLWAGDDHLAKSSTTAHQSEFALMDAMVPVLNPATLADVLSMGMAGIAMSRFSGLWIGQKLVTDLMDATGVLLSPPVDEPYALPDIEVPPGGLNIRWPDHWVEQERRLHLFKIPAALAFARANRLDAVHMNPGTAHIGIVATGKAYLDVREALSLLDIDEARAQSLGLSVYKVAMSWPLEPEGLRAFARGKRRLLVVEEKRSLIETQARDLLFGMSAGERPAVLGKIDDKGAPLLPAHGELTPTMIARAIAQMAGLPLPGWLAEAGEEGKPALSLQMQGGGVARTPYFCSGCPHNSSTKVPEGSVAQAGIGCHFMAVAMNRSTSMFTQMGGEGVNWVGQAPFTERGHMFQNLGDGTYFHSGSLAIRAAVAAGTPITFKILFNDAVAMTGGQSHDGTLDPARISRQVAAEGVAALAVVSDDLEKYGDRRAFAPEASFHHRRELDEVQRGFREVAGVTVIIYDQTCAAEKRRRRKRGLLEDPARRVFINTAVCEGCGDCSKASNCLSIVPVETEFGRKRQIEQSSCNKDYSCVEGYCPSFVTVEVEPKGSPVRGDRGRQAELLRHAGSIPSPTLPSIEEPYNLLVAGIGGTGVVTVGAILGMAAHLERRSFLSLDVTGLAQKGGPVLSHLRFAGGALDAAAPRIGAGRGHALLGCDMLTAGSGEVRALLRPDARVVLNTLEVMPGMFNLFPDLRLDGDAIAASVGGGVSELHALDFGAWAVRLFGDAMAANMMILGFAYQKGMIPLNAASIDAAIDLNGASVAMNKAAFAAGRVAAADPSLLAEGGSAPARASIPETVDQRLERRRAVLREYQSENYARRYQAIVERIRRSEANLGLSDAFSGAVVDNLFKLMAYKDEYEVARLHTDGRLRTDLLDRFGTVRGLRFHMAPPLFAPKDAQGRPRKVELGSWLYPVLRLLAKGKHLRGTPLDPFGHTEERRFERSLVTAYTGYVDRAAERLSPDTYPLATRLAALPAGIRGYGYVKRAAADRILAEMAAVAAEIDRMAEPAAVVPIAA